jgi:hypothetical protein
MLSTEQFYASFDKAGFLKTALWKPSSGAEAQEVRVRFKAPTDHALAGEALSTDYSITYPASLLPGLKRAEVVTIQTIVGGVVIDSTEYTVREGPSSNKDGTELEAKLRKGT